ncbi:MAG: Cys-tRNA(Pro) deacylase [Oscillospiraceae bacterium]|nr:Cys-tRNA(Pro) deacylase [Oscillospiraceae bacterium]
MTKTNVMRLLEAAGIPYEARTYAVDENDLSGEATAVKIGLPPERLFKTLALRGEKSGIFICCIPCHEAIDLRKAARAIGDKKAEMLAMKDLLPATGYIRGGVSPIGIKRKYPIFLDEAALLFDEIAVSAGMRGAMVLLRPEALVAYVGAAVCDLTEL